MAAGQIVESLCDAIQHDATRWNGCSDEVFPMCLFVPSPAMDTSACSLLLIVDGYCTGIDVTDCLF